MQLCGGYGVKQRRETYGATGKSAFLFLIGSDIVKTLSNRLIDGLREIGEVD